MPSEDKASGLSADQKKRVQEYLTNKKKKEMEMKAAQGRMNERIEKNKGGFMRGKDQLKDLGY